MKKIRATDKHPISKKLEDLFSYMEKNGISLDSIGNGTYQVMDTANPDEIWELVDLEDDYNQVGVLPPMCEYKLIREVD